MDKIINNNIYKDLSLLPLDLQGWHGNDIIFQQLIDKINPKIIIEVGSWKGQSAINMALHCKKTQKETLIYCVDTWLGSAPFLTFNRNTPGRNLLLKNGYPSIYYQFLSNVVHKEVQNYIHPIPNTSFVGSEVFKYFKIKGNMIYIDASHEEIPVYNDMSYYWPLVAQGGIMFGDDYNQPQVARAVNSFCKNNSLNFTVRNTHFWMIEK